MKVVILSVFYFVIIQVGKKIYFDYVNKSSQDN